MLAKDRNSKETNKIWVIGLVLLILFVFLSLYCFIYHELIKLPSDNWSNGVLIDKYSMESDFYKLRANSTFATRIDKDNFINVVGKDRNISIKSFDIEGNLKSQQNIKLDYEVTELAGQFKNNEICINTYSKEAGKVFFYKVNPVDYTIKEVKSYSTSGLQVAISKECATLFNDKLVKVAKFDNISDLDVDVKGSIQTVNSCCIDGEFYTIAAYKYRGKCVISALGNTKYPIITDLLYEISSNRMANATSITIDRNKDLVDLFVTIKDSSSGESYFTYLQLNKNNKVLYSERCYVKSYDAIPYIVNIDGNNQYLLNQDKSYMERTEISKRDFKYSNLYIGNDTNIKDYKQLTKSNLFCRNPSCFSMGDYEYLIYTEHYRDENRVYLASNNPTIIEKSQDKSLSMFYQTFIRTIVNYPSLIFYALSMTVKTLLIPIFVLVFIMMFKLSWYEKNAKKVSLIILCTYTFSKAIVFIEEIFNNCEFLNFLPTYLKSDIGHWGMFILITLMTGFVVWNKEREVNNNNVLQILCIYIIFDITMLNLYFLPYRFI